MSEHEAGDTVSVSQVGAVPGGFVQFDAGADHQTFIVGELPAGLTAVQIEMVADLEGGWVNHIGVPVGIDLLGEAEVSRVASALVQAGASESGPGIGGGGL